MGCPKSAKYVFLAVLICTCVFLADAQSDAMSTVRIDVRDAANNPIRNMDIKIFEIWDGKSKIFDLANVFYKDNFYFVHLGLEERGTFLIRMAAAGFESKEFKVFFRKGQMQTVTANLRKTGTDETERLERTTVLSGLILDHTGARVRGATVAVTDRTGKRFEITTEENGYFAFHLPYTSFIWNSKLKAFESDKPDTTRYDLMVTSNGFKNFEMKGIVVANSDLGNIRLDVVIEPLKLQ